MRKIISITIPTFNREKSIYNKTKSYVNLIKNKKLQKEVEILIVDNCSDKYDIFELLKEFNNEENKSFLRIIKNEKNIGMTKNIIKTMQICEGDFYYFNGDDDPMEYENIAKVLKIIIDNKNKYNVFVAAQEGSYGYDDIFKGVDKNTFVVKNNILNKLIIYYIANGNTFARTECLKNLFEEKMEFLTKYPIPQASITLKNLQLKDEVVLCNYNILKSENVQNNSLTSWSVNYTRFSIWYFYDREFNLDLKYLRLRHPILKPITFIRHFLYISLLYHFSDTKDEREEFLKFFDNHKLPFWYTFFAKNLAVNKLFKYSVYLIFLTKSILVKRKFFTPKKLETDYQNVKNSLKKNSDNHHWDSNWFEG